jgi:hypothetical protein
MDETLTWSFLDLGVDGFVVAGSVPLSPAIVEVAGRIATVAVGGLDIDLPHVDVLANDNRYGNPSHARPSRPRISSSSRRKSASICSGVAVNRPAASEVANPSTMVETSRSTWATSGSGTPAARRAS